MIIIFDVTGNEIHALDLRNEMKVYDPGMF